MESYLVYFEVFSSNIYFDKRIFFLCMIKEEFILVFICLWSSVFVFSNINLASLEPRNCALLRSHGHFDVQECLLLSELGQVALVLGGLNTKDPLSSNPEEVVTILSPWKRNNWFETAGQKALE